MPCLDYDNHVEVRLIKDKPPPPKQNNGFAFFAVAFTLGLTLFKFAPEFNTEFGLPSTIQIPTIESIPSSDIPNIEQLPDIPLPVNIPSNGWTPNQAPLEIEDSSDMNFHRVQIEECNGHFKAANFRSKPSLSPSVIKGAVMQGEWVEVTGRTSVADGITWYEARNLFELARSLDSSAPYQGYRGQWGWIAACFVE